MYDVQTKRGEEVPKKKADKWTKISWFLIVTRDGAEKMSTILGMSYMNSPELSMFYSSDPIPFSAAAVFPPAALCRCKKKLIRLFLFVVSYFGRHSISPNGRSLTNLVRSAQEEAKEERGKVWHVSHKTGKGGTDDATRGRL